MYQFCPCCLFLCELMSLLESCLAMRRGLSNPTRPSLLGPHRVPSTSTEVRRASVTRMSPTSASLTPTAFQEECSRRDTLSVTMRPLVSLPHYPDFSEYLTMMNSPTSGLNRDARQTAAVSRYVSELHGKKYRILEIYVFAAWKPVLTCRGGLQGQR